MKPVPFVYVTNMERSLDWYRRAIPHAEVMSTSPWWSELSIDGAALALHGAETITPGGQVGLAFAADRPLEDIAAALGAAGIAPVGDIVEQPFGRSLTIDDPDGLKIQINEHAAGS